MGRLTPFASRSRPIVLHSMASLATAPRDPPGALSTYSSACDKLNDEANKSRELDVCERNPGKYNLSQLKIEKTSFCQETYSCWQLCCVSTLWVPGRRCLACESRDRVAIRDQRNKRQSLDDALTSYTQPEIYTAVLERNLVYLQAELVV